MSEKEKDAKNDKIARKNEFVEIVYTGYANGEIFDSNIPDDLKKLNPDAKPEKTVIVIGQGMVVRGLDRGLEGKEIGKEYEISFSHSEGFGERHRELIRTLSLRAFSEQKVAPRAGMILALDNQLVKILAVSGARVIADFNNPLAGKELRYKFKIIRKVRDLREKAESLFKLYFKFVPEFEIKEERVVVKGPKGFERVIELYKDRFKELASRDLGFEEMEEEKKQETKDEG